MIARAIHEHSPRASGPFVKINCTAIPENLLESELFGYEKGAFTGANIAASRENSNWRTTAPSFSMKSATCPRNIQVKLLRVLQEREFERLGSNKTITVDVRVIAATNRDLRAALEEGTFREDLYYRLNVVRDRHSSAARSQGRHPRARPPFRREVRARIRQADAAHHAASA